MARKRHSDEDILKLLREIELRLAAVSDVKDSLESANDAGRILFARIR